MDYQDIKWDDNLTQGKPYGVNARPGSRTVVGTPENLAEEERYIRNYFDDQISPAEVLLNKYNDETRERRIRILPVDEESTNIVNEVSTELFEKGRTRIADNGITDLTGAAMSVIGGTGLFADMIGALAKSAAEELGELTGTYEDITGLNLTEDMSDIASEMTGPAYWLDNPDMIFALGHLMSDGETRTGKLTKMVVDHVTKLAEEGKTDDDFAKELSDGAVDMAYAFLNGMGKEMDEDPVGTIVQAVGLDALVLKSMIRKNTLNTAAKKIYNLATGNKVVRKRALSKATSSYIDKLADIHDIADNIEVKRAMNTAMDMAQSGNMGSTADALETFDSIAKANGVSEDLRKTFKTDLTRFGAANGDEYARDMLEKVSDIIHGVASEERAIDLDFVPELAPVVARIDVGGTNMGQVLEFSKLKNLESSTLDIDGIKRNYEEFINRMGSVLELSIEDKTAVKSVVNLFRDSKYNDVMSVMKDGDVLIRNIIDIAADANRINKGEVDAIIEMANKKSNFVIAREVSEIGRKGTGELPKGIKGQSYYIPKAKGELSPIDPRGRKTKLTKETAKKITQLKKNNPEYMTSGLEARINRKKELKELLKRVTRKKTKVKGAGQEVAEDIPEDLAREIEELTEKIKDQKLELMSRELDNEEIAKSIMEENVTVIKADEPTGTGRTVASMEGKKKSLKKTEKKLNDALELAKEAENVIAGRKSLTDLNREIAELQAEITRKNTLVETAARKEVTPWTLDLYENDRALYELAEGLTGFLVPGKSSGNVLKDVQATTGGPFGDLWEDLVYGYSRLNYSLKDPIKQLDISEAKLFDGLTYAEAVKTKHALRELFFLESQWGGDAGEFRRVISEAGSIKPDLDPDLPMPDSYLSVEPVIITDELAPVFAEVQRVVNENPRAVNSWNTIRNLLDFNFVDNVNNKQQLTNHRLLRTGKASLDDFVSSDVMAGYTPGYIPVKGDEAAEFVRTAKMSSSAEGGAKRGARTTSLTSVNQVAEDPFTAAKVLISKGHRERFVNPVLDKLTDEVSAIVGFDTPASNYVKSFSESLKGSSVNPRDTMDKAFVASMIRKLNPGLDERSVNMMATKAGNELNGIIMGGTIAGSIPAVIKQFLQKGYIVGEAGPKITYKAFNEAWDAFGDHTRGIIKDGGLFDRAFRDGAINVRQPGIEGIGSTTAKRSYKEGLSKVGRALDSTKYGYKVLREKLMWPFVNLGDLHSRLMAYRAGELLVDEGFSKLAKSELTRDQLLNFFNVKGRRPVDKRNLISMIDDAIETGNTSALKSKIATSIAVDTQWFYGNLNKSLKQRGFLGTVTELFTSYPRGFAENMARDAAKILEETTEHLAKGGKPIDALLRDNIAMQRLLGKFGTQVAAFGPLYLAGANILPWIALGPLAGAYGQESPGVSIGRGVTKAVTGTLGFSEYTANEGVREVTKGLGFLVPGSTTVKAGIKAFSGEKPAGQRAREFFRLPVSSSQSAIDKGKSGALRAIKRENPYQSTAKIKVSKTVDSHLKRIRKLMQQPEPKISNNARLNYNSYAETLRLDYIKNGLGAYWIEGVNTQATNGSRTSLLKKLKASRGKVGTE